MSTALAQPLQSSRTPWPYSAMGAGGVQFGEGCSGDRIALYSSQKEIVVSWGSASPVKCQDQRKWPQVVPTEVQIRY